MVLWLVAPSDTFPLPARIDPFLELFSCRTPRPELVSRFCSAVGLPLFPVRKSIGEPESAVMLEKDARPVPQCKTEGLALRRSFFQQLTAGT